MLFIFDTPILRDFDSSFEYRNNLYDIFVPIYGKNLLLLESFSSLFEYLGLRGLDLVVPSQISFSNIKSLERAENQADNIHEKLCSFFGDVQKDLVEELCLKKNKIIECLNKNRSRFFLNEVFYHFVDKIENNYIAFAEEASCCLAWDYICSMSNTPKISKVFLNQYLLGHWVAAFSEGQVLPLLKLLDVFTGSYLQIELMKNCPTKGFKCDMVDSDAITSILFKGVIFVTYDNQEIIKQRISLTSGAVDNIKKTLHFNIPLNLGKVYCLSRPDKQEKSRVIEILRPVVHPYSD